MMKLTPDDPRLSAYLLGELSADERREIERAAAGDPAIRLSLREMEKTCRWLSGTLGGRSAHTLHSIQRQTVRDASREVQASAPQSESGRDRRLWHAVFAGAAAAAVIGLAALLFSRLGPEPEVPLWAESAEADQTSIPGPAAPGASGESVDRVGARAVAAASATGAPDALEERAKPSVLPEAESLPQTLDQSGFSSVPSLRLPVLVGHESFDWVRRWIRERGQVPPSEAVRVEELINTASLETVDWVDGLELGTASADCPWDDDTRLIGIQLVAAGGTQTDLRLESHGSAERRVLGSFGRRDDGSLPTELPDGRSNLVVVEVRGTRSDFGELVLRRGEETATVDLTERAKPGSAPMAHAVAMASFGRWLRGEIDREALERATARAESLVRDPVRRDSLTLIREAMAMRPAGVRER